MFTVCENGFPIFTSDDVDFGADVSDEGFEIKVQPTDRINGVCRSKMVRHSGPIYGGSQSEG
jgi:hypothetical protein